MLLIIDENNEHTKVKYKKAELDSSGNSFT